MASKDIASIAESRDIDRQSAGSQGEEHTQEEAQAMHPIKMVNGKAREKERKEARKERVADATQDTERATEECVVLRTGTTMGTTMISGGLSVVEARIIFSMQRTAMKCV